jgi:anti-sigma factor RsiW
MCEFSRDLVAWLDGELAEEETASMREHVRDCDQCRELAGRLRLASEAFAAYRMEFASRPPARKLPRWVGAVAAGLLLTVAAGKFLVVRPQPAPAFRSTDRPFLPIPYVPPLHPLETARVMRMDVPVASLIAAGFRLPGADPSATVKAEVVVGEDGQPHAVRLIGGLSLN